MRQLTDEETEGFFKQLSMYIGRNIRRLIERPDGNYVFRLHADRVYYLSEPLAAAAECIPRKRLLSAGVCFGKFTKTRKFRVKITALPYIAELCKYRVDVKPNQEMSFLYGNHVLKSGLGRITENTPKYQGVAVFNMDKVPLGFGRTAAAAHDVKRMQPTGVVCFHQADTGEYLRDEQTII